MVGVYIVDGVVEIEVGDAVRFADDDVAYSVMAISDRFMVCSRPYPRYGASIATIVDLDRMQRGPLDVSFNRHNFGDPTDCLEVVGLLESGNLSLAAQRSVPAVFK